MYLCYRKIGLVIYVICRVFSLSAGIVFYFYGLYLQLYLVLLCYVYYPKSTVESVQHYNRQL